ncbi:MAG: hypothetical protein IKF97_00210 [Clostridia bacterium]|nr:hypothetical protein [Clostridia bacterium]
MENMNNLYFSNNNENKRVNIEYYTPNKVIYKSNFGDNKIEKSEIKYIIKRDKKVFDE